VEAIVSPAVQMDDQIGRILSEIVSPFPTS